MCLYLVWKYSSSSDSCKDLTSFLFYLIFYFKEGKIKQNKTVQEKHETETNNNNTKLQNNNQIGLQNKMVET